MKTLNLFILSILLATGSTFAQNIFTYKVGECEVFLLSEEQLDIRPHLLDGHTPKMLKECAPKGTMPHSMSAYMIRMPDKKIVLVDAGLGVSLFRNLAALNVRPEDVNEILITHMHYDHIGSLLNGDKPAFPNARLHIAKAEENYWKNDTSLNGEWARKTKEAYYSNGKLNLFQPGQLNGKSHQVIPGFQSIAAYGHTPGHTMYMLTSGKDKFLFWGDLTHAMNIQMTYPEVALIYDVDQQQAAALRIEILEHVSKNKIPVAGAHVPYPGMGRVEKLNGKVYRFTAFRN